MFKYPLQQYLPCCLLGTIVASTLEFNRALQDEDRFSNAFWFEWEMAIANGLYLLLVWTIGPDALRKHSLASSFTALARPAQHA
jgi:hypothetical protein